MDITAIQAVALTFIIKKHIKNKDKHKIHWFIIFIIIWSLNYDEYYFYSSNSILVFFLFPFLTNPLLSVVFFVTFISFYHPHHLSLSISWMFLYLTHFLSYFSHSSNYILHSIFIISFHLFSFWMMLFICLLVISMPFVIIDLSFPCKFKLRTFYLFYLNLIWILSFILFLLSFLIILRWRLLCILFYGLHGKFRCVFSCWNRFCLR